MKISELSERSGVPIPTIKFYIREGLLPAGERTAQNQAQYTETHVSLLGIIRILKDELGMSVPAIARVTAADPRRGSDFLEEGLSAIAASRAGDRKLDRQSPEFRKASEFARELFRRMGWEAPGNDAASEDTIAALITVLRAWPSMFQVDYVEPHARAAKQIAEIEIPDEWNPEADPIEAFRYAVLGTYLFEPLILALRRVAHGERSKSLVKKRGDDKVTAPAPERRPARPRGRRRRPNAQTR